MANGTLNFTIKGINIGMKVSWNYAPPASGGDTFTSIKKGSKATLEIIQNKSNNFIRQLYIRKENKTDTATFEMELQKAVGQLQKTYPFLSVKMKVKDYILLTYHSKTDRDMKSISVK